MKIDGIIPVVAVADVDPIDNMRFLCIKLRDAKRELAKAPSYGKAVTVQKLKHDIAEQAKESRGTFTLVYDFHEAVVENIERIYG